MKPLLSSPVHSFFVCVTRRRGLPRPRPSTLPSRFCHPSHRSRAATVSLNASSLILRYPQATGFSPAAPRGRRNLSLEAFRHPSPCAGRRNQEQGRAHPSWLCPVWRPWCDCVANLVASCRVENALNDLLSVLAHLGAQHPLLRTPKDVPVKPCPESTHLTLGSPPGTPGCKAATQTRAARSFTMTFLRSFASSPTPRLAPAAGPSSSPATRWSLPPQGALQSLGTAITALKACAPPRQSRVA
jgi:hypothetical protein